MNASSHLPLSQPLGTTQLRWDYTQRQIKRVAHVRVLTGGYGRRNSNGSAFYGTPNGSALAGLLGGGDGGKWQ